jgi:hypothetical protein
MARHAVAMATVLLHTLMGMVCAMPGPGAPSQRLGGGPRLQCASCLMPFGSLKAVRTHQAAMGPGSPCSSQRLAPVASAWSGRGPRAAGRVEELSGQRDRLSCVSDSDSETGSVRGPGRRDEDLGGGPAGEQEDPVDEQEDLASADHQETMDQVQIRTNTCIYIHISAYTSKYLPYTYTCHY